MMKRLLSLGLAAAAMVSATPALANGTYYRAEPAAPPAAERVVVRDLVWKCGGAACVSGRSNSRAATDCEALVRKVGALKSFAVEGQALAAPELEKCNARAR